MDFLDPHGTKGVEALFKELQGRPDFCFAFPDESDRALGDDDEDILTTFRRTQEHNAKELQKRVLSQYIGSYSLLQSAYRACGDTTCRIRVTGKRMHTEGIIFDTIRELFDTFLEDIKRDWMSSTLLMVQIGKCKQAIMSEDIKKAPYLDETAKVIAFWKTLFAGQQTTEDNKIASRLPLVPHDWKWRAPSPTVLESGRLELAEIRAIASAWGEHLATTTLNEGIFTQDGFDRELAADDFMLDAR